MEISEISAIGYAMAMTVFALLTVLLLSRWQNSSSSHLLAVAAGVTLLWGAVLAMQSLGYLRHVYLTVGVELLRGSVWLAALIGIAPHFAETVLARQAPPRYMIVVGLTAFLPFAYYVVTTADPTNQMLLVSGGYLLSVLTISAAEQIYRGAPADSRVKLNYFCLAVAGMFVFDLLAFVLLIAGEPVQESYWAARGFVSTLVALPLGIGIWRSLDLSFDTKFPRQIVFYSFGGTAVGIYAVLSIMTHYYVRTYAGSWGEVAGIVFATASIATVATVLISPTIRARVRVFVTKTFFQYKYDYRKEWLRFISTLSDADPDKVPSTAIRAVAQIVHSPGGVVWLQEQPGEGYLPSAALGCDLPTTGMLTHDSNLVRFLTDRRWVIDIIEMCEYPSRYENLDVEPWIREQHWWLIVPLLLGPNLYGFIFLLRPRSVQALNFEDHDLLKTIGRHVAIFINQAEFDRRLAESSQFGTYNRLTAFLMHDLNNLVAQQSLVVANAERHRDNPKFIDDAIDTIAHSVTRMKRLMGQLSNNGESAQVSEIDIHSIIREAIARGAPRKPEAHLSSTVSSATVIADPEKLTAAFEHLIRNAQDATDDDGSIDVRVLRDDGTVVVRIEDSGVGMTPEFVRERLFRPFDSTKGSQSMGIGAYQAREYVRMLGGQVSVVSAVGNGSKFTIRLPVCG